VELGRGDNLCKLLHIHWLDIDDVYVISNATASYRMSHHNQKCNPGPFHDGEGGRAKITLTKALIADIQVPQVDS